MTRFLVLGLLLVILWLAVERFWVRLKAVTSAGAFRPEPPSSLRAAEVLLPCATCGAYVPANRALRTKDGGGEVFCSEACATSHQPLS